MKIFNTLVCTIEDLKSVVHDYLSGDSNNSHLINCTGECTHCYEDLAKANNTLAIDLINEFKANLSDFVRDFKPAPQKIKISGYVKNPEGQTLDNVRVSVKGEVNSTKTSLGGYFDIYVYNPKGKILTFSLNGYATEEVEIVDESKFSVTLDIATNNTDNDRVCIQESKIANKSNFAINSPRLVRYDRPSSSSTSLQSTQEKAYIEICNLYYNNADSISNAKLVNALSKYLDIPCLDIKCAKSNDIKIKNNGQLIAAEQKAIDKTKIQVCRIAAENDVKLTLTYNDDGVMTTLQSKILNEGEYVYVTGLDFDSLEKYIYCEILDLPKKSGDKELEFLGGNTTSIGSIMHIRSTSSSITPPLTCNDVVSAAILVNGDVLWIDVNGQLKHTTGQLALKIKPLLSSRKERLVYVKAFEDHVLTLSENGNVRIVNTKTISPLQTIEDVYSTQFIKHSGDVYLEVKRFGVGQIERYNLSNNN